MTREMSKPVLIGLSLLCLVCLVGIGFVVRDVALSLAASATTAAAAGIAATFAVAMILKALVWQFGTRRDETRDPGAQK